VRIVAADAPYTDAAKQMWLSDRDFIGGRRGMVPEASKVNELGVYYSDRIGSVRYVVPVVAAEKYTVKLYFREPWFGRRDLGTRMGGRRIFDVSANGVMLLKNFDISAGNNLDGIVKTFEHVEGSPQGQIVIYLSPVLNYPLINAIEVLPEG
jgi:Malectin domain